MHANWTQNACSIYLQSYQSIPIPLVISIGEQEEPSCPLHPPVIDQVWAELSYLTVTEI